MPATVKKRMVSLGVRRFGATLVVLALAAPGAAARAADYYVDAISGDDARSGRSPAEAWRTFKRPNATTFQPGDALLLRRGSHWSGTLTLLGSGTIERPIRIAAYGAGLRPVLDGESGPALLIHDQDAWEIEGLEFTNRKDSGQDALKAWAGARRPHHRLIRIRDCVAHDAGGNGIHVGEWNYGNYDDVAIEDSVSFSNQESGIFIEGRDFAEVHGLAIRRSVAYSNGGDGIKIYGGRDAVIEECQAYKNGWKQDARVGIWCWNSENVVIQSCESYENVTPGGQDGGGFDIDWSCLNCTIQYCYSHDNDGAGYLFMGNGRGFTARSRVRFNISQNDGRKNEYGGILCFGTLQDSEVYNNAIYFAGAPGGAALHFRGDAEAGFPSNIRVFNNVLIAGEGSVALRVAAGAATQNNDFDFNDYSSAGGLEIVWGEKTFREFDAFRDATGGEAHGFFADPRLRDAGHAPGGRVPAEAYRLLPHSPCQRTGAEYKPAFGERDYWGKLLNGITRLNIGPEQ